jgi:ferredoxin
MSTTIRRIIQIDENKCNGCGLCTAACHYGALSIINGKARLSKANHCKGLGECLLSCPAGAISFSVQETATYEMDT